MVSHLIYFASFRTRFCLSELQRACNYLGESAFSSSLSNHKDSINYGHATRTRSRYSPTNPFSFSSHSPKKVRRLKWNISRPSPNIFYRNERVMRNCGR